MSFVKSNQFSVGLYLVSDILLNSSIIYKCTKVHLESLGLLMVVFYIRKLMVKRDKLKILDSRNDQDASH